LDFLKEYLRTHLRTAWPPKFSAPPCPIVLFSVLTNTPPRRPPPQPRSTTFFTPISAPICHTPRTCVAPLYALLFARLYNRLGLRSEVCKRTSNFFFFCRPLFSPALYVKFLLIFPLPAPTFPAPVFSVVPFNGPYSLRCFPPHALHPICTCRPAITTFVARFPSQPPSLL